MLIPEQKSFYAWCLADGVIYFGPTVPHGGLVISKSPGEEKREAWEAHIKAMARHGHQRGVYLVPGVPEAENQLKAVDALSDFAKALQPGVAAL